MDLKGGTATYGVLAAALHWLSAAAILVTVPLGFAAARAGDPARAAALLRLHLPLGLAILGLTLARIVWWTVDVRPEPSPDLFRWQGWLARGNHALLYALLVLLCASGIGLVALSHAAPSIFSGEGAQLPDFSAFPPMAVHVLGAFALIGLLALHLAAVVYHWLDRRHPALPRMRVGGSARRP